MDILSPSPDCDVTPRPRTKCTLPPGDAANLPGKMEQCQWATVGSVANKAQTTATDRDVNPRPLPPPSPLTAYAAAGCHARASLQYSKHFRTSATEVEPCGTGYSSS